MSAAGLNSHRDGRQNPTAEAAPPERDSSDTPYVRRYPVGAELMPEGGTHFRVWAPRASHVAVELLDRTGGVASAVLLSSEAQGYHAGVATSATAGTRYRFRLPHGSFPDPASRYQPDGPHGASAVIDPDFAWNDDDWDGREPTELVLYELHVGTFSPGGTWGSAMAELPELARSGITGIEIMPVAEFPGAFGWGYDGVGLFAPCRIYGTPTEARRFIDRAHQLGIAVILDVVYNHLGPDGCYLGEFSSAYFTSRYHGEWGQPLNFDGPDSGPVREFFVANARYWIDEFHFDGLRLDATQQIYDASPRSILAEISAAVHDAAPQRRTLVIAENETQHARLVRPAHQGGYGFDAVWNDDFHHAAIVAATGRREAYYLDYLGTAQELVSACKHGFLFQGQWCAWQQQRRGTPALDLPPARFINYLQNHDQVANSLRGLRLHQLAHPGTVRALTALLLLTPGIPLLFQGQEFAASSPFLYFADHRPDLAAAVATGRQRFLEQFRTIAAEDTRGTLAAPDAPETFRHSQLDLRERDLHRPIYQLHQDLLRLRQQDELFRQPAALDGAVLGERSFVLRFFAADGQDRLLLVNLAGDLYHRAGPEPLLAPVIDGGWTVLWSSESPAYGGLGTPTLETATGWIIPGPAAFVLIPSANRELAPAKLGEKD